jgi:hypothetical protein
VKLDNTVGTAISTIGGATSRAVKIRRVWRDIRRYLSPLSAETEPNLQKPVGYMVAESLADVNW